LHYVNGNAKCLSKNPVYTPTSTPSVNVSLLAVEKK